MLDGAKLDAQLAFPGGLKQFFTNWRVSYPTSLDGQAGLRGSRAPGASGLVATFYFDKQTGLLTRMVRYADIGHGPRSDANRLSRITGRSTAS